MDNPEIMLKMFRSDNADGLYYDIYLNQEDEPTDGGLCTSGTVEVNPDGGEFAVYPEGYTPTREDWKNALDMANEQILNHLFPQSTF